MENPAFEQSYERLFGSDISADPGASEFFHRFYQRFLTHPEVAAMFKDTEMSQQVRMLKRSLFDFVGFYISGTPSAEISRVATIHRQLNVNTAHLDWWLDALLETVLELDPQADEQVKMGWALALTPGLTVMRMKLMEAG